MVTSQFFNNYKASNEQRLHEDLIIENIKIHGDDMWYIPRNLVNEDTIFGEDDLSTYTRAYLIELYIKSYDGFEGDGNFISKFGLEIRNQVTLTVSKKRFEEEIGDIENISRPKEGDLIYFPLNKKTFEIKYVDNKPFFYPFGSLLTYDMNCELFEYSSEVFDTGIDDIDSIGSSTQNDYYWAIQDEEGNAILDDEGMPILPDTYTAVAPDVDPIDDSQDIQVSANNLIDWSVSDPFSDRGIY